MKNYLFLFLFTLFFFISGCIQDDEIKVDPEGSTSQYPNEVANHWITLELELIKETPGFTPPVGSRAIAYTGIALYESVVGGMSEYQSLYGQLNEMPALPSPEKDYIWPLCANGALAVVVKGLFPTAPTSLIAAIDSSDAYFIDKYSRGLDVETAEASVAFGREMGAMILEWAKTDGGHGAFTRNFPSSYVAPEGPGLWKPDFALNALQPYWGENRCFIPENSEIDEQEIPTPYSEDVNSEFYKEAHEVYEAVNNLTAEQKIVANYWTDDPSATFTPPGHTLFILKTVIKEEDKNLAFAAEAYAKLGMAISDAFIFCWKNKFSYNLLRPDQYIQQFIDPYWEPFLVTPPFPEYTSGHSVQSGAAAEVMTGLFGDNYSFVDKTHEHLELGLESRSYSSFYHFAEEAAISRLYGGIHFRPAIDIGVDQGIRIGKRVNNLQFLK